MIRISSLGTIASVAPTEAWRKPHHAATAPVAPNGLRICMVTSALAAEDPVASMCSLIL